MILMFSLLSIPTGDDRVRLSIHRPHHCTGKDSGTLLLVKAYLAHRPELKREQMAGNKCGRCFAWNADVDGDVCKGRFWESV